MAINMKKTKVMGISKASEMKCSITLNNMALEQVNRYKYLGSRIKEVARYEEELKARIGMGRMAKAAFWQNKEIMRRNVRFGTKKKIIDCYVFSVCLELWM